MMSWLDFSSQCKVVELITIIVMANTILAIMKIVDCSFAYVNLIVQHPLVAWGLPSGFFLPKWSIACLSSTIKSMVKEKINCQELTLRAKRSRVQCLCLNYVRSSKCWDSRVIWMVEHRNPRFVYIKQLRKRSACKVKKARCMLKKKVTLFSPLLLHTYPLTLLDTTMECRG